MIIFLKPNLPLKSEKEFRRFLADKKVDVIPVVRQNQTLLVVTGRFSESTKLNVKQHPAVASILETDRSYKLAAKSFNKESSKIKLNGHLTIGGKEIILMAGPCSVESKAPQLY